MVEADGGTSWYGNLLHTVFLVFHSPDWWVDTGANIHVCADISLFFSYQVGRTSSLLMGNGARAAICGVGTVDLKLTSEKTVQLKNVHHVPSIKNNLISGSLLCRDGFKLMFESNYRVSILEIPKAGKLAHTLTSPDGSRHIKRSRSTPRPQAPSHPTSRPRALSRPM